MKNRNLHSLSNFRARFTSLGMVSELLIVKPKALYSIRPLRRCPFVLQIGTTSGVSPTFVEMEQLEGFALRQLEKLILIQVDVSRVHGLERLWGETISCSGLRFCHLS